MYKMGNMLISIDLSASVLLCSLLKPVATRMQVRPSKKETDKLHLGISEAPRPFCMDTILQDAFTYVFYCFGQSSFPVNKR